MRTVRTAAYIILLLILSVWDSHSQCTTLGQNPSTAFPVCGSTVFEQEQVPICGTQDLFVPGCDDGALYANKNPFWYKFTCFQSGALSFTITPHDLSDDYDWQLYDVTGINPDQVFTNRSIIVTGNWSGSSGLTGASSTGTVAIQCASSPDANIPRFAKSPNLIQGHDYILLISHYTDSQSGYSLSFGGNNAVGAAVITDPTLPHLKSVSASCDGQKLTVKLNKKMKCGTLTAQGSEFSIFPAITTVVSAVPTNCTAGFDFDEITITLAAPVTTGDYQLVINNGTDLNTVLDNCDRPIDQAEQVPFHYETPRPITYDSIGKLGCSPNQIKVYFPKKIFCNSIAANGSDFRITGPTIVNVISAAGENCVNDLTDVVLVKLDAPIFTNGNYTFAMQIGGDGTTVIDECGLQSIPQAVGFVTYDTVSARFDLNNVMGCQRDTVTFIHNGANSVNSWQWTFNSTQMATTPSATVIFPATSTNTIQLVVKNQVCADTVQTTLVLDNEVKASFDAPIVICPEDEFKVVNTTKGTVDVWQWKFGTISTSNIKDPALVMFPPINLEKFYTIKLVATNSLLGCSDSSSKQLRVLDNCFIAVPTAFTPNNDGLNDFLYPNNALKADNLEFKVYNRWGQIVFQTKDWTQKWNGKVNGVEQGSGVFVWFLSYTNRDTGKRVFQKGTTTLIRK